MIEADIREAMANNDGTLDEEDFQKIRGYYGFGVPAIVGEGFCTLRGKPMSTNERITSTYQGALTGLYDDFFDKTGLPEKDILKMMDDPSSCPANTSLEKLFVYFLDKVHQHLPDRGFFSIAFKEVFKAQVESKKQTEDNISFEKIKEITFCKGGHSLLFYRSAFEHPLRRNEKEALYNAGSLMQLGNDIFDTWKDAPQGIHTLTTVCEQIDEVRQVFKKQLTRTIELMTKCGYDEKNKRNYINKLVLGISRCFVALDQLERLERKSGGKFCPELYTRKEMVCDMEKPLNMLKSMWYWIGYKY